VWVWSWRWVATAYRGAWLQCGLPEIKLGLIPRRRWHTASTMPFGCRDCALNMIVSGEPKSKAGVGRFWPEAGNDKMASSAALAAEALAFAMKSPKYGHFPMVRNLPAAATRRCLQHPVAHNGQGHGQNCQLYQVCGRCGSRRKRSSMAWSRRETSSLT
jgi:hypothetical protein